MHQQYCCQLNTCCKIFITDNAVGKNTGSVCRGGSKKNHLWLLNGAKSIQPLTEKIWKEYNVFTESLFRAQPHFSRMYTLISLHMGLRPSNYIPEVQWNIRSQSITNSSPSSCHSNPFNYLWYNRFVQIIANMKHLINKTFSNDDISIISWHLNTTMMLVLDILYFLV